jgi:hypothetical protein
MNKLDFTIDDFISYLKNVSGKGILPYKYKSEGQENAVTIISLNDQDDFTTYYVDVPSNLSEYFDRSILALYKEIGCFDFNQVEGPILSKYFFHVSIFEHKKKEEIC